MEGGTVEFHGTWTLWNTPLQGEAMVEFLKKAWG